MVASYAFGGRPKILRVMAPFAKGEGEAHVVWHAQIVMASNAGTSTPRARAMALSRDTTNVISSDIKRYAAIDSSCGAGMPV